LHGIISREGTSSVGNAAAPDHRAGGPSSPDLAGWTDLGPVGTLAEGRPVTRARPDGGSVVVFLHASQTYAIDNACTHEDGPVGEGEVRGTCVRCPYHDWEFDFTTGDCRTDPERPLATWSVAIDDGRIRLGPQLRSGTPHRGGDHNDGMETIVQ
jgi:nitrite reductase/ring-hydroxylating ferredoxin subunit